MDVPRFSTGETLSASKLNALADCVREALARADAATIRDTSGGLTFDRSPAGTTLSAVPIPSRRAGDDSDSAAAGTEQGNFRRLFRWSSSTKEEKDANGNAVAVFDVEVSSGLAFLRPHQVAGTSAGGVGLAFGKTTTEITGFTAELPKKQITATLIQDNCEGVSVITDLRAATDAETDSEGITSVGAKISIPVPAYTISRTASRDVITSISTGTGTSRTSADISVSIPALTGTSSGSEFLTSATLSLNSEELSANPTGKAEWTRTLVLFANSKAVTAKSPVTVKTAATKASGTATFNAPTTTVSATTASVPTGWKLEQTSSESVEKDVSFTVAKVTTLIPTPPTGVEITQEATGETETLEIVGNGNLELPDFARMDDSDAAAMLSESLPDDASEEPAKLYRVAGATFRYSGKDKLVFLNVVVSAGGTPAFYWSETEIPSEGADGTEIATDEPQALRAAVVSAFRLTDDGFQFGIAAGTTNAFEAGNWRASIPMAAIWATDDGPEVEALTWGCVEFAPRIKLAISNGGTSCEGITTASVAVPLSFPELEAQDFQLITDS